jgi:glycosyltransferase involved in cell wall biosynthesis
MRVALVTSLTHGGPLDHSVTLAGALTRAGVDVTAVCSGDRAAERFRACGATAFVVPLRHQLDAVAAVRIRRLTGRCDVVHAQDRRSGLWTRLPPHARGAPPTVYTFHGLPDPYLPEEIATQPSLRDRLAYERLDPALARRSAAVVVPSRFMAGVLTERLRFPVEKLAVIPNGVEPGTVSGGGDLVGTVSVLEPVKGLDVFVRAAAELKQNIPDAGFVCFGEGSSGAGLASLASSLGLDGHMRFPGHVPAARAFESLRVFVLSSWMENAPLALMQAMSAGIPVVATRVGGVPEIAEGVAELVPAGDASALAASMRRLIGDPVHAAQLADAARARVETDFSAERTAREHLLLYERLLSTPHR